MAENTAALIDLLFDEFENSGKTPTDLYLNFEAHEALMEQLALKYLGQTQIPNDRVHAYRGANIHIHHGEMSVYLVSMGESLV
jgi:hypothetical protein